MSASAAAAADAPATGPSSLTLQQTLSGHTDRVWCCAWSPSGRALATCGGDKQCRIWVEEEKDGQPHLVCKQVLDGTHSRTIRWVSWSPNGKFLASAGFDGITAIWENQNGEFECVATLEGHENEVKCVSWSRNGQLLATCSRDKTVWIWGVDTSDEKEFECQSVLNGHTQDVKVAKWHPTIDSMLISASYDNTIRVWTEEDDDWYATETLTGHTSTVWSVAFNHDGTSMATSSDDASILVWDRSSAQAAPSSDANTTTSTRANGSWQLRGAFTGQHSRCIYTVDWSKTGFIASGAADDAICIFGPTNAAASASSTATSANTTASAAGASTAAVGITLTSTALAKPPAGLALLHTQKSAHAGDVNCVGWNPTRAGVLASAGDDGVIKIWKFAP